MKKEYLFNDLRKAVSEYPHPQMALVPFLKILSKENKPIEPEDIKILSQICSVKAENIIKIIDYYPYFDNPSKSSSVLCVGLPCYLKGANMIAENPQAYLDDEFHTLEFTHCLGVCHEAPVVRLANGTKYNVSV